MEANTCGSGTMLPTSQITSEHSSMEDIGTQLINVESMNQTIRNQVRDLENNGSNETTVLELKSLLPKLAGLQSSLRKSFDAYARPGVRQLHIFNLPEELLMKIFEDTIGPISWVLDPVAAIKSLRLTCRRFCDASSHLLLHELDVSVSEHSLEHLIKVSCHPTISKGIRVLRIRAALFKPLPVTDLQNFIQQVVGILQKDYAGALDRMLELFDGDPADRLEDPDLMDPDDHAHFNEVIEDLRKRNDVMWSCTVCLRSGEKISGCNDRHLATLCHAFSEYSRLWDDQKTLLEDGIFVRSVARAVKRLPPGVIMTITDHTGPDVRTLPREIFDTIYDDVRDRLLDPSRWTSEITSLLTPQLDNLLCRFPNELALAGNPLTTLCICLYISTEYKLGLSEEQAKDLVSAAEHLKFLEIRCRVKWRTLEEQVSLSKLVSLYSKGPNLRSVVLGISRFPCKRGGQCAGLSDEPLLALLPWANLREIRLISISIHFDELSEHLKKLAPGTYISLDRVYLRSGYWADLLDVLRAKTNHDSEVVEVSGKDAQGLDTNEFHRQTGRNMWATTPNPATEYIRGKLLENPLRSSPAQDTAEQDDMDQDDVDGAI